VAAPARPSWGSWWQDFFTQHLGVDTLTWGYRVTAAEMKQNLPWSVSGIPPEAREAARAAASREGMSLGDWLTQRILDEAAARAFADEQPRSEQKSDWPRPARPSFRV
jgi:hypothetical protein